MSLVLFAQDRVARGRMEPVAVARVNALVRRVDNERRLMLCVPGSNAPTLPHAGKLEIQEIRLRDAGAFVNLYHRHLAGPVGHLFSLGCTIDGVLVGAAVVGRPVSRYLDDGSSVEITRVASSGVPNVCSKLLGAARREAQRRGYARVLTYTLSDEPGTSLRAAGFVCEGPAGGGKWSRRGRRRADRQPTQLKMRWSSPCADPRARRRRHTPTLPCLTPVATT